MVAFTAKLPEKLGLDHDRVSSHDHHDHEGSDGEYAEYDQESPERVAERPAETDRKSCQAKQSGKEPEQRQDDTEHGLTRRVVQRVIQFSNNEIQAEVDPLAEVEDNASRLFRDSLQRAAFRRSRTRNRSARAAISVGARRTIRIGSLRRRLHESPRFREKRRPDDLASTI